MIRAFLALRLVDHLHVAVVPILLGRGVRLWDGLEGTREGLRDRGHVVAQRRHARDVHARGWLKPVRPGAFLKRLRASSRSSRPS